MPSKSTTCARSSSARTAAAGCASTRSAVSRSRSRGVSASRSWARTAPGKSTLVRLLSTLLLPDGGTARIFGHDISETRAVRRLVNRVSVEASFFKKMSAVENLAYAARFYGMTPRETKARIPEILDRVGFPGSRRSHAMEHLSRGTQQKVALARALLTSPVLLLLDEPTTGLDPRSKLEVQDFIREVRARPRHDHPALHPRPRRGGDPRRADRHPGRRPAALPRAGRGHQATLCGRDARGGVLLRDRALVRGGAADEEEEVTA